MKHKPEYIARRIERCEAELARNPSPHWQRTLDAWKQELARRQQKA